MQISATSLQEEVDNNPLQCRILDPAAQSWTDRDKPLTVTRSDKKVSRMESQTLYKNLERIVRGCDVEFY